MIKQYLLDTYGYNEPIFLNDLKIEGMSDNAVRQAVKRLSASGFLERYDTGIYYIPETDSIFGNSVLDASLVIEKKYLANKFDYFGYYSGISFTNLLGLTTQHPAVMEITTNNEATNGRNVTVGNQRVYLKKSSQKITKDNVKLLQFIDSLGYIDKYAEVSEDEIKRVMKEYIRENAFTAKELSEVSESINGKIAKRLIDWGLIYEFAR